ncbi:MAG: (4Fe-4S)-binding protein, partial [Eubacterium sp.]
MKKVVITDQSLCMACLSCEFACSEAFYKEMDSEKSCIRITAKPDKSIKTLTCVQCGKCAKNCEAGAITQNAKGVYMINKKL